MYSNTCVVCSIGFKLSRRPTIQSECNSCYLCKICKGLTAKKKLFTVHYGRGTKRDIEEKLIQYCQPLIGFNEAENLAGREH